MTEHLGYERHAAEGRGTPNSRNGTTPKRVTTEIGEVDLAVPRDLRAGPQPVRISKERAPHQHQTHSREHLRPRPAARRRRTHRVVDQALQTQPVRQRTRQKQTRVGHQRALVEHRLDPVQTPT